MLPTWHAYPTGHDVAAPLGTHGSVHTPSEQNSPAQSVFAVHAVPIVPAPGLPAMQSPVPVHVPVAWPLQ